MTTRRRVAIFIVVFNVVAFITIVFATWAWSYRREQLIHHNLRSLQVCLAMYMQMTNGQPPASIDDLLYASATTPEILLGKPDEAKHYRLETENIATAATQPSDEYHPVFSYSDWGQDGMYYVTLDGTVRWNKF